jgi:uncharacterized protein
MSHFREISATEIENNLLNLKQLTFEVTDTCNLQCKYCGYGDLYYGYDKRESKCLPTYKAKLILDYLSGIWKRGNTNLERPTTYISFYGGEPLLNMQFIKEIVAYVENMNLNRDMKFSMTTNAMLLDRYMEYFVDKRFHLLISLDGDKEAQSYRVTKGGKNSFDTVIRNVEELQRLYPDYFDKCVNFNSVLHNRNSVEGTYQFIKNKFGKVPTISELNNSEIREDRREEYDKTYRNKRESIHASENYRELSDELFMGEPETYDLLIFLHQYSGNVFRDYNDLFVDKKKMICTPTGTCVPFWKKMFITVNGKIIQCERINHAFALGIITDSAVCLDTKEIVNKFNSYLNKMKRQCENCYRQTSCTQCLYYIPDIDNPNAKCLGFMDKDGFKQYASYCLGHLKNNPSLYKKLMTEVKIEQ